MNEWAEPLPEHCPPSEAGDPNGRCFYRMVSAFPPDLGDFDSHQILWPEKVFSLGECRARSLSVWDDLTAARIPLTFGKFKNKKLALVKLPTGSGVIQKFGKPHHWSWWRSQAFQVLAHCQPVE